MTDEFYMRRCLELAVKGLGRTSPNPLVGCVITHENQIIGEGFHNYHGGPHAEVNAIESVNNKELLKESKLFVTLEPCSHFGLTPPCANLIVKHQIPKVVICNTDPYKKVSGNGIKLLKENGVQVTIGVLENAGNEINKRFFESHRHNKPYIILKWAQNQNGLIDKIRSKEETGVNWITQKETKSLTHQWRAQEDAILVGANTVLNDSPKLNVRYASGKHPIRLVLDPNGKIPANHVFWTHNTPVIVYSYSNQGYAENVQYAMLTKEKNVLHQVMNHLHSKNVLSVMVEGGAHTINQFIKENLWNEARIITGYNNWQTGVKAPSIKGKFVSKEQFGNDQVNIIRNS